MIRTVLKFDIEDNFVRDELKNTQDWESYEYQVGENTKRILSLLGEYKTRATFFVLGKVGERRPELVEAIYSEGHEIAIHGYSRFIDDMGKIGLEEDLLRSKAVLENIVPIEVLGHRSRSFSIGTLDHWALEIMARHGFLYDSSILSSKLKKAISETRILKLHDDFYEVCPSSQSLMKWHVTISGGTLFRLAPLTITRLLMGAATRLITYAHAWEFNRNQPKRKVSFAQSLSQSPFFYTTRKKRESLLRRDECSSIAEVLAK